MANNAGGPHCLARRRHRGPRPRPRGRAARTATVVVLGGEDPEPDGLRPAAAPSSAARGCSASPPRSACASAAVAARRCARCCSTSCRSRRRRRQTVSAIIAAGIVPAAIEMMDARDHPGGGGVAQHAGFPLDAAAVLIVEVDGGCRRAWATAVARVDEIGREPMAPRTGPGGGRRHRAGSCSGRAARRRSARSPGSSRTTTCTTPWCPGRVLPDVLRQVYEIAAGNDLIVMNVFHAGDGNLHPLLVFDKREPGVMERVHAAGHGDRAHIGGRRRGAHRRARHRRGEARPDAADVRPGRPRRPGRPAPGVRPHRPGQPGQGVARRRRRAAMPSRVPDGAWM